MRWRFKQEEAHEAQQHKKAQLGTTILAIICEVVESDLMSITPMMLLSFLVTIRNDSLLEHTHHFVVMLLHYY